MGRTKARLRRRKRRLIALTGVAFSMASLALLSGVLEDEPGDRMQRLDAARAPDTLESKRPTTAASSADADSLLDALSADPALTDYLADDTSTDLDIYSENGSKLLPSLDDLPTLDKKTSTNTRSLTPRRSVSTGNGRRARRQGSTHAGSGFSGLGGAIGRSGIPGAPPNAQTSGSVFDGLASLSVTNWGLPIAPLSNESVRSRPRYSRRAGLYYDPCLQAGTVVSPCFRAGVRVPASSETLLSGLAGSPTFDGPNPGGFPPRGSATPPGPAKTPGTTPGDGPGNGITDGEESTATPVPVPGSAYLIGVGILLLLRGRPASYSKASPRS